MSLHLDKKEVIESMKKIIKYVSQNSERQIEIFREFQTKQLERLFVHLNDDNQYLRRASLLLICELLHNNPITKNRFAEKMGIYPKHGRIAINDIPQSILPYPETLRKSIELMKQPIAQGEENFFCWTINLEKKNIEMEYLEYQKFTSFTFLDPKKCIVGITIKSYVDSFKFKTIREKTGIQDEHLRNYSSHNSPARQSFRNRKSQRQQIYPDLRLKLKTQSYQHQCITLTPVKKQQSYIKTRNKIQQISQYARNSYGAEDNGHLKFAKNYQRPAIDEDPAQRRSRSRSYQNRVSSRSKQRVLSSREKREARLRSSQKFFDKIKKLLKQ